MDSIKRLTDLFSRFPTIGNRTAGRFVFYLIKQPKEKIDELAQALQELAQKVKLCAFCFNPHETQGNLCLICQNPARNKQSLCIVEKEADLLSIEATKKHHGLYFIYGNDFLKEDAGTIRMGALAQRLVNPEKFGITKTSFSEIIIALNPTPEGKSTSVSIERGIKELKIPSIKITHLAQGLPVGGELEC